MSTRWKCLVYRRPVSESAHTLLRGLRAPARAPNRLLPVRTRSDKDIWTPIRPGAQKSQMQETINKKRLIEYLKVMI